MGNGDSLLRLAGNLETTFNESSCPSGGHTRHVVLTRSTESRDERRF